MYMFNDGLVRLCTEEYVRPTSDNLGDRCMHLTNYAINKFNDNFQVSHSTGVGSTAPGLGPGAPTGQGFPPPSLVRGEGGRGG